MQAWTICRSKQGDKKVSFYILFYFCILASSYLYLFFIFSTKATKVLLSLMP